MSTTTSPGPASGSGCSPYWNFSGPPWPVRYAAFMASSSCLRRRRNRQAAGDAVPLDQAGDDAGSLRLLDEIAQEGEAGGVFLRRADRLLHGGELTVENARSRQLCRHIDQARPQPG